MLEFKPRLTFATLAALLLLSMNVHAAGECNRPTEGVSELPVLGPLELGNPLDQTLLQDSAMSQARRAGFVDYLQFRAVSLPVTAKVQRDYCVDPQNERAQLMWHRHDCAAVVVSSRSNGQITRLIRDCSILLPNGTSQTAGARLAAGVLKRYGDPMSVLVTLPSSRQEHIQSTLMGLR